MASRASRDDGGCHFQGMQDLMEVMGVRVKLAWSVFIQRNLMRAFVGQKDAIRNAIVEPDVKRLKMVFNHPLGKLKYKFDAKNSAKIKDWLSREVGVL